MSLLPSATFAGPSPAEAFWAVAGSAGPGGGVTQLIAGTNITLEPPTGEGVVTINASGGGGGGVTSIAAGPGITVSNSTGAVTVNNAGVTQLSAGPGISLSGTNGAVQITNSASAPGWQAFTYDPNAASNNFFVTGECGRITLGSDPALIFDTAGGGWQLRAPLALGGAGWDPARTIVTMSPGNVSLFTTPGGTPTQMPYTLSCASLPSSPSGYFSVRLQGPGAKPDVGSGPQAWFLNFIVTKGQ